MSQIVFDEKMVAQLEALYSTRDVLRRRRLVREALGARSGERIVDVGCGPAFYVDELAEQVGDEGWVVGVDPSPPMLEVAAGRTAARSNVAFHQGDAAALPLPDGGFDAALCVQVLEYVEDVTAALRELRRVVRPGGRVLVWDVDWRTVAGHEDIGPDEAAAWAREQRELAERGEFYFACVQLCFTAMRPEQGTQD
jgi:ubiquinone/menaquinone biosynthesis C-methylase UbiE